MSDYDYEDFENGEDNSPAGLRKALKKAQDAAKKERELREAAEAKAAAAEKTAKKSNLTEILKDKGVKPALVRFLEQDGVEATPEAVDAWVQENREVFNIPTTPAQDAEQEQHQEEPPAPEGVDNLPPELAEALRASQQLDASGVSPSEVGVLQRIASVSTDPSKGSYEQLIADLKAAGVPTD